MKAFILRPSGKRNGIDFDRAEVSLFLPALQNAGATEVTTAERLSTELFAHFLAANVVIADISDTNPAALYELSIRQALNAEQTLLIRARSVEKVSTPDHYFEYDATAPERSLDTLTKAVREMRPPQKDETVTAVPYDFSQEVQQASTDQQAAKLILLGLEVKGTPWESLALAQLSQPLLAVQSEKIWERVVLFTGHRVDGSNRKTPRFPAKKEPAARDAIRQALEDQLQKSSKRSVLGVAGGANGGDILFLETCEELGIATELALALPQASYVKASVDSDDKSWISRFSSQLQKHSAVQVLAHSSELPQWLAFKNNYDIWQRNNLWLLSIALSQRAAHRVLIALWDGRRGDGPGGTEHMVSLATARDAQFVWLKTNELFGLATIEQSAAASKVD